MLVVHHVTEETPRNLWRQRFSENDLLIVHSHDVVFLCVSTTNGYSNASRSSQLEVEGLFCMWGGLHAFCVAKLTDMVGVDPRAA